jgi:hypothetical protein
MAASVPSPSVPPAAAGIGSWAWWKSHVPRRAWPLVVGLVAVVIVVGLRSRSESGSLVSFGTGRNFSREEFRELQSRWVAQGLDGAEWRSGEVFVPGDQLPRYTQADSGSQATANDHWADAWQSANERLGQFTSGSERDAAKEIARAQAISRLLEELPDVARADVVWDEAKSTGWRAPARACATVYLLPEEGRSLTPDVIDAVRRAVSGSKANLSPADVTVMDQRQMIAYDGSQSGAADSRLSQLVGTFRTRLEAACNHLPDVRVTIHAESPSAASSLTEASTLPIPVLVDIAVPESTISSLAGLNAPAAVPSEADGRKRREIFRRVESQLQTSLRADVESLIPAGLTLADGGRVHISTRPSLRTAAGVPTPAPSPLALLDLLRQHGLLLAAAGCLLGVVWMFRPARTKHTAQPTMTVPAVAKSPEILVRVATPATTTSEAFAQPSAASDPLAAGKSRPTAEAERAPTPQVLRDLLARLEQMPRRDDRVRAAHPADKSVEEIDARRRSFQDTLVSQPAPEQHRATHQSPATTPTPRLRVHQPESPAEPIDLQVLLTARPTELRRLTRDVDVETWEIALCGADRRVLDHVLLHCESTLAAELADRCRTRRPVRLRELDAALELIGETWQRIQQNVPQSPAVRFSTSPGLSAA